jgi:hypothetical protein
MQVRQFLLQRHMVVGGAGDIACAAGPGARAVDGALHGVEHRRVLAHAQIIVAAPDGDPPLGSAGLAQQRMWECAAQAQDVHEDAITPLGPQSVEGLAEPVIIVHRHILPYPRSILEGGADPWPVARSAALRHNRWIPYNAEIWRLAEKIFSRHCYLWPRWI